MKEFKLFTNRASENVNPGDLPEMVEAKRKQAIINKNVSFVADDSDINPPSRIQYGRRGRAIRAFEIDGVFVEEGEEIRYNVN